MKSSTLQTFAEHNFKRFWFAGLSLGVLLLLGNIGLMIEPSPMGILDHQKAATAANVNAIQLGWEQAGLLGFAKVSMIVDLIFIGIYFFGASCGAVLMLVDNRLLIKRLGALVMVGALAFMVTDYIETILQTIQLFQMQGDDCLASTASNMGVVKVSGMIVSVLGISTKLVLDKRANRP